MAFWIPVIEITDYANTFGIGCPNRKAYPLLAFVFHDMTAHFFIQAKMFTALKERDIEIGEERVGFDHVFVNF
jgi:hypothetical protein